MEKSYNQKWKESGTTLTYKEWRKREDEKMASFGGVSPKDSLTSDKSFLETKQKMSEEGGYKTDTPNKTTFGIKNYILVLGGLIIVSAIAYKIYKKNK
jgi:hypothetical protein